MQTILVPTDFSDSAKNALSYAARLAVKLNASVVLLHAYMLPTPVSEVPYAMLNAEEMQRENERFSKDVTDKLTAEYGISARYLVRLGFPSDEIQAVIEDEPIDLVVMGMKGKGALEKMMGSTTTSTIKKIDIPTLVVPDEAVYNDIRQVTYATDFSYKIDFRAYDLLLELLKTFQASLHIVHVQKNPADTSGKEVAGQLQLDPAFKAVPHDFHIIKDNEVKHGIQSYLETHKTDLLVMVTHEHSFFERLFGRSHTKAMVYDTHVPLLVLKDK
ncbi:MAG: universal stress protein [Chitinophagaceae bacterium]